MIETLSQRQTNTILAALRYWQYERGLNALLVPKIDYEEIATNGGENESLSDIEIDSLCEALQDAPVRRGPERK